MKLTLYMAISVDGKITRGETDSDWVSETDWDQFYQYVTGSDAVIMGRKTMDQFEGDDFPMKGPVNIVLTRNKNLHNETETEIISDRSPKEIMALAKEKGWENLLLIGGEDINGQFLEENLIDEMVLSVHPLIIGEGLTLFSKDVSADLERLGTTELEDGLIQVRYKVKK
ncbi:dihydrofolate reductase family protein [Patescibacteria group bacterium]